MVMLGTVDSLPLRFAPAGNDTLMSFRGEREREPGIHNR
jgi:hypothetical protein